MKHSRTLLVALFFASLGNALAQAPGNDLFANRYVISGTPISTNGTTVGAANRETGEPTQYFQQSQQTVWYEWTAPATATTTLSISGSYRETIAVYTGTAVNALTLINNASAGGGGGTTASLNFNAAAGTSYKIQVGGRNGANGTFTVTVSQATPVPTVNITAPSTGQSFTNPTTITLSAAATAGSGTVTNVTFFYGGSTVIGLVTNSPFTMVWSNITAGNYTLTARATDTSGQSGTSAGVNITVRPAGYFSISLVGSNSVFGSNSWWRYKDDGSDQGVAWIAPAFDDSSWKAGPGQLGYGDGDEATVVEDNGTAGYNAADTDRYITTYFRQSFVGTNAAAITNLVARFLRDDGVVGYLNGVEVIRNNIAAGQNYLTTPANATDDGVTFFSTNINPALLTNGVNVFAAEIHQTTAASSDISWYLELTGDGAGPANQSPNVGMTSPANNAQYFGPSSIGIVATASDADGAVTNVDFIVDGSKLGQKTTPPYTLVWNSPPLGPHVVSVVAADNLGATASAQSSIVVYDSAGTPLLQITSPTNNSTYMAPASLSVSATAYAPNAVTNVEFYANSGGPGLGSKIGQRAAAPYTLTWNNVLAASYALRAVLYDSNGVPATSAVVNVSVTNSAPPTVAGQNPAPGTVSTLTSVQVTFSKTVTGVDASDLLVNGTAATGLSGSGSVYTFTFTQPPLGTVNITWAVAHGIQDLVGQPFNATGPGATWSYTLADSTPPTIATRTPVAGATVTNLNQITVGFSENVMGVNASDLLINGSPAVGLGGGGATYTFSFPQPPVGTVNISWAASHGITDLAGNPFTAVSWTYTLQIPPTLLIASNVVWRYMKGLNDTSTPNPVWRQNGFDDSAWTNSPTPYYYGDPYTNTTTGVGTLLSDMNGAYQCVLLRKTFVVPTPAGVSNLIYRHQSDDGFVAWINGTEVLRYNMGSAPADPPYVLAANLTAVNEPNNSGAAYIFVTNAVGLASLVPGTNVIAVQAFNASVSGSSDFGFDLQLEATTVNVDPSNLPPTLLVVSPPAGDVFALTSVAVTFSEPVTNVNATDLLINGTPASGLNSVGGSNYTFSFTQPGYGNVAVTWASGHGIEDFDSPPKPFDGTAPGATFQYTLVNPNAPTIASQSPVASATVSSLTQVSVTFSKAVINVDAADLRINGSPATGLSGSGSNYTFTFPQPAYGNVSITWAAGHGITDTDPAHNAFDTSRPGATWVYTLADLIPPTIATKNPPAGANVTNLTLVSVTFSENVTGVDAADFLVNGTPALNYGGSGSNYTFVFSKPNTSVVNINWAANHGITDTAGNPFSGTGPGETWSYFTPDNVPPAVASITPTPNATVRSLTQVAVTFNEPVTGVSATDLLINNVPAASVLGSAAGPYTFFFTQPATGGVEIIWAAGHGITDLATPPNSFAGGEWNYVLNPNAVFADKILINEIMYLPSSKVTNDEWIELRNIDTVPINLSGWKFTKGVNYTFPNVSIPAGGYLVVVCDTNAFKTKYPSVTSFVGPWAGNLANNGETIRLETAVGETVNEVDFATEGDWAVRQRGLLSGGYRGWVWNNPADGFGPSLELMNPAMPNKYGRNWRASTATNGTPGAANAAARLNIPPLILDLAHTPAVPRSTDPIVVSAKILDERTNGLTVTLFYRNATTVAPPAFSSLTMFDDGAHNDGVANDTVFAATIPAQADKTVIEFYVQAVDADNNTNYWPAVAYAASDQGSALLTPATSANALLQVDDTVYTFPQPLYRLILTEQERRDRDASSQNAEFNTTFITFDGTGTEVRYNASCRERGAGSRGAAVANQRVNIPTDRRWKGQRELNINSQSPHAQYAGSLLCRKAGLDSEFSRIVRLYINGTNNQPAGSPGFGCYIHQEAPDSELVTAHWPQDDGGNLYRLSTGNHTATLAAHQPPTSVNYSNLGYLKASNSAENDYSDLTNLTYVLNIVPNSIYEASVRSNVNVENWLLYFAMNTLLANAETSIGNGYGDDGGLYHAPIENKFYMYAHDWDSVLGLNGSSVSQPIMIATALPSISRFLTWANFAPAYTNTLRRLCQTVFSPGAAARTLDEGLAGFTDTAILTAMKQFVTNRVANVLSQLTSPDTNVLNVAGTNIGGTISANTVLAASNGTYFVTSTLTIASGATLTIQPGVTVKVNSGVSITVANGGRLLAEGTAASPILFTRNGASGNWGNVTINGAVGSPETRITYARFEFNANNTGTPAVQVSAGTVFLDHLTFGNTAAPYIHVDGASFVISHCEFPANTGNFELVHGTGGIKSGGRGLLYRNYFGPTVNGASYNDSIDFTGGNRPGPIIQIIDNVFAGSQDDLTDLDGTDAWVEGNIFLHAHRQNGSPDSASAVSGGNDSGNTSEISIIGNIFYDVDQAATAKQLNFYTFINNTVVHQSGAGYLDAGQTAVLNFADDGIAQARGMYVEGNVLYDIERITRNVTNGTAVANNTTFNGNVMPLTWGGPGASNSTSTPIFKHVPTLAETTNFTNWASAQILRDWLSLVSGSPGVGDGPNGSDKGVIPVGATVAVGAGAGPNDAILTVGVNRTGGAITASGGFPNGTGYTHYKWRLDGGAWSAETPIGTAINVPGFKSGTHRVDVSGKRDSATYQDDPEWAELAVPTTVYSGAAQRIRLNEVLASNQNAVNHEGTHPDLIELYNPGSSEVDISGLRLTDDAGNPNKFIFPTDTTISAGGYLVVYANNPDGTSGLHAGFNISKDGQTVYLYDTVDNGGVLIDSITFGLQVEDFSVGRVGASWALCVPTPGGPNVPAATGPASRLFINEILAAELTAFPDDFVEIYNPQTLPVAMAGLFFTDNPAHWPNRSQVPPLTFIGANSYIAFHADGDPRKGSDHLDFSLEAERGLVALLNTDYSLIDCYLYGPQRTDVSQGRIASNIYDNNYFTTPTPGSANPTAISTNSGVVINEVLAANQTVRELDGSTPDWIELYNLSATNVNLSDFSLSDSSLTPRKYVFTNGIVIPANGYLRLRCDGSQPASTTNTGFNIKAEGGSVFLFDKLASGGALLNAVTYGLQAVDFSISRFPNGTGAWTLTIPTPGGASIPATTASANLIKINEWMAAPNSGEDWFELWNPSPQPVAVGGFYTTDDLNNRTKSQVPALSYLGASTNGYQRFWADSSPASGANHTGFKLNNGGESIGFANPSGTLIDSVTFTAQQTGVSEGRFPDGTANIVRFPGTESPGEPNYLLLTNVVINEALTHTDPPFEDAIELRNLTAAPVNIGNWWLSDAKNDPRKYRIPNGTTVPANGYIVFYEYQFNSDPTNDPTHSFALSSAKGDQIFLSSGDTNGNVTGYRTSVDFGAAQNAVSLGRYVTSDGNEQFVAMSTRSFGQDDPGNVTQFRTGTGLANPYPQVGPVVVAQIMYHPPDNGTNDNTLDEFIELRNTGAQAALLYDALHATNTWRLRDAVDYDFPQGVSIPAGGNLLLVSFDPINSPLQLGAFRTKYNVNASVPVYGPYTGKLANSDDKVELYKPDNPDAGFVPFVLVDRVHYRDSAPWDPVADGTGSGLKRVSLTGFGNDPTNWVAVVPNFGGVGGGDTDGDGMPDAWENQYGLDPNNPADANLDADGDGATNLQEYLAGTNPTNAASALRITRFERTGTTNSIITFLAVANHTYTIEYKHALTDPSWLRLVDISAASFDRTLQINTVVPSNTFFRLRTPQAP